MAVTSWHKQTMLSWTLTSFQRICSDEMPKLGTVQLLLLLLALHKKATQDWKGEYSPDNFPKTGRWEGCLLWALHERDRVEQGRNQICEQWNKWEAKKAELDCSCLRKYDQIIHGQCMMASIPCENMWILTAKRAFKGTGRHGRMSRISKCYKMFQVSKSI